MRNRGLNAFEGYTVPEPSGTAVEAGSIPDAGSSQSVHHNQIAANAVMHPRTARTLNGPVTPAPPAVPSSVVTGQAMVGGYVRQQRTRTVDPTATAAERHPGQNVLDSTREPLPLTTVQNRPQTNVSPNASGSTADHLGNAGRQASTSSASADSGSLGGTSARGERRGLFFDDLGSLDRYPSGLTPLKVAYPDPDALTGGDDYAMQTQLQIEHQEHNIIMFDKEGSMFHLGAALGHRDVHRFLAAALYQRQQRDLDARILPPAEVVRFLRIPTRPTLQEISSHFEDCHINDAIWSLRKGTHWNDLTRNSLLIVVFASPSDARNADVLFRQDRWFAKQSATLEPMKSSKKNPTCAPNWEFFDLCRRLRLQLLRSISLNCLLSDVSHRMPPAVQRDLEEKGARGLLSLGNSLNKPSKSVMSNAVAVRPPLPSQIPSPFGVALAPEPVSHPTRAYSSQRYRVTLRPPSRPQADESQALILHRIVKNSLEGFFKAFTDAHPCRIWNGEAMLRLLQEAVLRHPPITDLINEKVDAAGLHGTELRRLRNSNDTTILIGTAVTRDLPVFTRPKEYQGGMGTRSKMFKVRTFGNIDLVRDALVSATYAAISLRNNPGFDPAVRILAIATEDRAFVVDLAECSFEDSRLQALLASLLTSKALLCFESQSEVLRFQSLCTAQTGTDFEARLYDGGFTGPSKILQKCSLAPAWQPTDEAMLQRYHGLELYVAKYLGALLNTAYDEYLYCASLNEYVYEETGLRAIAMAMLLRRCQNEVPDLWLQMDS